MQHNCASVCSPSGSGDSTGWKKLKIGKTNHLVKGRVSCKNIFRENEGIRTATKRLINTELDAFTLFITESVKRTVLNCTKKYAEEKQALRNINISILEKFIGLQLARGLYGKAHSVDLLWSKNFGLHVFQNTMSRQTFRDIKRFLRFDEKNTRSQRLVGNPFAHISAIFDEIILNFRNHFTPGFSVCIDEQLMPLKCRCKFIVFMPNKPDKFGMKFWLLVDN